MPRFRRIADRDRIFFVTTNIHKGVRPFGPVEMDLFLKTLAALQSKAFFRLFGYAVMPDHIHLLLAPFGSGLAASMHSLKRSSGYEILQRRGQSGTLWQARYFDNIIRRVRHFWEKLEYIHNNPVEAGLATRLGDWKWSSYAAYAPKDQPATNGAPPVPVDGVDLPADGDALLWPAPWR